MKKIISSIFLAICFSLLTLILGCSKDDGIDQTFEGKKLFKTIEGEFFSRYTYKSNGLMDSIIYESRFNSYYSIIKYNSLDQIIQIDDYYIDSEGNHIPDGGTELKYENGLVSELIFPDGLLSLEYANGLCTKQSDYVNGVLHSTTSFTYNNSKNIIGEERVRYKDGDLLSKIGVDITFDSSNTPESYLFQFIPGYPASKNNPVIRDQTVIESASGSQFSVGDSKYEYEYDSDGYPTKVTEYYGTNGENDWSQDSIAEYIYQ